MSAGLIPVLKEYQVRKGEAQAKRLARIVFSNQIISNLGLNLFIKRFAYSILLKSFKWFDN